MKTRNFLKSRHKGTCYFLPNVLVTSKRLKINCMLIILLVGLFAFNSTKVFSQSVLCGFDEYYDSLLVQIPQLKAKYNFNEHVMDFMFSQNPMAITSCEVYTIPVVVHVIHPNESLGVRANITDAQIVSAIEDLNAKFRNEHELSYDICIEFCLAQQDPYGNPTTGINRINAYDECINSICYQDVGIVDENDQLIKNLSRWPNTDYINIWIVSEINGNDGGGGDQGYATFPGTPAERDGIVIQYTAFGTVGNLNSFTDQNTVLLHEMGHFLFLYHTFQGDGNGTTCPPEETDCFKQGDKICETVRHKRSLSNCNPTGTNSCDSGSSNEKFVHNYMDYSNEDCKYLFVEEQRNKMRCALMGPRATLSYSLGCMPPCSTVVASYTGGDVTIGVFSHLEFTNTSINGEHFIWRLNSQVVSTDEDYDDFFLDAGVYTLCLDAIDEECINRFCTEITVLPLCKEPLTDCEAIVNGNFEQIDSDGATDVTDFEVVCGWDDAYSSPFFCAQPTNNAIGLFLLNYEDGEDWERIVTEDRLELETGNSYQLSFDYYVARNPVESIQAVLSASRLIGTQFPNGGIIISEIEHPIFDAVTILDNNDCYPDNANFIHFSDCFEYNDDSRKYLSFTGTTEFTSDGNDFSLVYLDNVSIEKCNICCVPEPDFTFSIDSCEVTFFGENTGDEGTYTWVFGDGTNGAGEEVTHEYKWPGIYNVCLIISCDESPGEIICKEVEIEEYCDDCFQVPTVTARLCSSVSDTSLAHIAQLSFDIPENYYPCGLEFFVWSDDVSVVVNSYTIDSSGIHTNLVDLSLTLTPIGTFDFDTDIAFIYISFCDSTGAMICYQIQVVGGTCNFCYDIEEPVIASCNTELGDSITTFIYDGTFILDLGFTLEFIETLSPEVGFSIDNFTAISPTQWSFDYSITTYDIDFSGTSVLFVFKRQGQPIYFCYNVEFDIDSPCPNIPVECKSNWTKSVMCSYLDDEGLVIFPTGLMSIPIPEGFSFCNSEPMVLIDDPYVVDVNGIEIIDDLLWFDISIHADRDSFGRETFVRFIFCNERGDSMVCQGILFKLKCNLILPRTYEPIQVVRPTNSQLCSVFPNPVSETLEVLFNQPILNRTSIVIMDVFGNFIYFERIPHLVEGISIDVGNYLPGIYFLLELENGRVVDTHKIAVFHP